LVTIDEQIQEMTANEIERSLQAFADAQRGGDADALGRLLTEDFKLVGPLGFVVPKAQWLEQFRTGALQIESLKWDEIDLRTHGYAQVAIAIGRLTQTATYGQARADGQFRVTAIALRAGPSWQLAGVHYSPIAAPGSAR
jgi:ketosteroid isomerase-like protein